MIKFFQSEVNFNLFLQDALALSPPELQKLAGVLSVQRNKWAALDAAVNWLPDMNIVFMRLFLDFGGEYKNLNNLVARLPKLNGDINSFQYILIFNKPVALNYKLLLRQLEYKMTWLEDLGVNKNLMPQFSTGRSAAYRKHKDTAWLVIFFFDDIFRNHSFVYNNTLSIFDGFNCPLIVKSLPRLTSADQFEDYIFACFFFAMRVCDLLEALIPVNLSALTKSKLHEQERYEFFFESYRHFFLGIRNIHAVQILFEKRGKDDEKEICTLKMLDSAMNPTVERNLRILFDGNVHKIVQLALRDFIVSTRAALHDKPLPLFLRKHYASVEGMNFEPFYIQKQYVFLAPDGKGSDLNVASAQPELKF